MLLYCTMFPRKCSEMGGLLKIAVVGSGIGGIATAWLLSQAHKVDVYESAASLGGHTRTIDVDTGSGPFAVDTGFMVFNRRTYPNFTRFLEHLGIDAVDADMSFSVQVADEGIEWSGTNLNTVFAQRRNLANPRFLSMLNDVLRLSRDADRLLADPSVAELTLGQLLEREHYGKTFCDWYLIPMGCAIWSTPPGQMLDYPALTFLRFCDNHGLLHVSGKPAWLSIPGGARRYIEAAGRSFSGEVYTDEPVEQVVRTASDVTVGTSRRTQRYDAVVLATHPPVSLRLLGDGVLPAEKDVLSPFDYFPNRVAVHTDESFMPRSARAWASWNWYSSSADTSRTDLVLTYRLNTLQQLPEDAPSVMVTLNRNHEPAQGTVLEATVLDHPMFTSAAIVAQSAVQGVQGLDRVYFAGAWTRYGFHEDGFLSAVRVASSMGINTPWAADLDPTHTLVRRGAAIPRLGQSRSLLPGEAPATYVSESAPHDELTEPVADADR